MVIGLVTVLVATKGFFAVVLVPVIAMYHKGQAYYRSTSTEVARLESVSRSPIFTHFSESLQGLATIRAYGKQRAFEAANAELFDRNTSVLYTSKLLSAWLCIRLEFVGSLTAFAVAAYATATHDMPEDGEYRDLKIPVGWVAVGLVSALQYTQTLKFCVQVAVQAEAAMNSVERIRFYVDNVPQETSVQPTAQLQIAGSAAAGGSVWPSAGAIRFESFSMRYRDGPLVLKGVSACIGAGEKVGRRLARR